MESYLLFIERMIIDDHRELGAVTSVSDFECKCSMIAQQVLEDLVLVELLKWISGSAEKLLIRFGHRNGPYTTVSLQSFH